MPTRKPVLAVRAAGEGNGGLFAYRPSEASTEWRSMLRAGDGPEAEAEVEDDGRDRYWVPALALLACARAAEGTGSTEQAELVAAFLDRRNELSYVTVDELIEGIVTLVVQDWPIVHEGALRFPFHRDPGEVEMDVADLQGLVDAHRQALEGTGVIPARLATRAVRVGDAFAMHVSWQQPERPVGAGDLPVLDVPQEGSSVGTNPAEPVGRDSFRARLGGLDGEPAVPIIDISWDAREQGKLAYWAAMAQPLQPDGQNWDTTQRDLAGSSHLARLAGSGAAAPGPPDRGQGEPGEDG